MILNYHVSIFNNTSVAANTSHQFYDIAPRVPLLKVLEITPSFAHNNMVLVWLTIIWQHLVWEVRGSSINTSYFGGSWFCTSSVILHNGELRRGGWDLIKVRGTTVKNIVKIDAVVERNYAL